MTGIGVKLLLNIHYARSEVNKLDVFECGKLFLCYLGGGVYDYTCWS